MKISDLKREMDGGFKAIDDRFKETLAVLRAEIAEEGERTRRHFDVVAERLDGRVNDVLVMVTDINRKLDQNQSEHTTFAGALDDHELRLKALERMRNR